MEGFMNKFLPILCVLIMMFAFGGAVCEDEADDDQIVSYPNCQNVCEKINECGFIEAGGTISSCVDECVEDSDNTDVDGDTATLFENATCAQVEVYINSKLLQY